MIGFFIGRSDMQWSKIQNWWSTLTEQTSQKVTGRLPKSAEAPDELHILDVGQGSATLIKSAGGKHILIDTGRHDDKQKKILNELDEHIGTGGTIDLLIFTHADSDHIGSGDLILDYYQVGEVWMNGMDHTTRTYLKLLEAIDRSDAKYVEPKTGFEKQIGDIKVEVWHPFPEQKLTDQNEASIMGRVTLSSYSVVFSGDASYYREDKVINRVADVQADYLIIGHHGAKDSAGRNWLNAVHPRAAFYSAGVANIYGHPHAELLYRVADVGIPLYGTDKLGTISLIFEPDGEIQFSADYPEGRPSENDGKAGDNDGS